MPRPIHATVHLPALQHNLQRCRQAGGAARVWAVLKANAYGHGIERVYAALRGADGLALLDLSEAERLRTLGWRGPILLLEGAFEPRDLELCSRLQLWHVLHRSEQIDWLAAHKTEAPQRVFLKLNSGMNRLGLRPEAFRAAWTRLSHLPQVEEIGLMTHFSDADGLRGGQEGVRHQLDTFVRTTHDLPGERSLCNSAALLRHGLALHLGSGPEAQPLAADWTRPGIALYGSAPDFAQHSAADWGLQATQTLASQLIAVQDVPAGETVGYGSTYTATHAMRIGIVACGYADGYPRHAPGSNAHGGPVLVRGVRTRLVGRVSMDMLAVDLGPVEAHLGSTCQPGDAVTLWGRSGCGALLPIDEVAHAAGTLGYELMCALAARVPVSVEPLP